VGISRNKNNEIYTVQSKLDVLSLMKRTVAFQTEIGLHFGLTNPPMNSSWNENFLKGGVEALDNPKGRPAMSGRAKSVKKSKHPAPQDEMTLEQKLERENELLRLEGA